MSSSSTAGIRFALVLGAVFLCSSMASAASFAPMPAGAKGLQIKFVRYTGGSSGRMVVDVRNASRSSQKFQPRGLYFVPEDDPDKAPQRLGAAGPFEVDRGQGWVRREKIQLRPGETRRIKLQVFCLDSHRSSPSAQHRFRIAKKLLPKTLRRTISAEAAKTYRKYKGRLIRPAAAEVQGKVWQTRNKKWIKIEGERKDEKSSVSQGNEQVQRRRYRPMRRLPIQRAE